MAKLLDCTLRDGGYQNAWMFPVELVEDYLSTMAAMPVSMVEIGFRTTRPAGKGSCGNATDTFIRSLPPIRTPLAVMVNASELLEHPNDVLDLFADARVSPVSMVRIAFHFPEIVPALPMVGRLKHLGYKVAANVMQASGLSVDQLAGAARLLAQADALWLADSLGALDPPRTALIMGALRALWPKELGLHTHDNRGLALANSLAAVAEGADWVDGTVAGMGRGPGNARTEQLVPELFPGTDLAPLVTLLADRFANRSWGADPLYHTAAALGIHPTYVHEMIGSGRSPTDILRILGTLAGAGRFDRSRLPK